MECKQLKCKACSAQEDTICPLVICIDCQASKMTAAIAAGGGNGAAAKLKFIENKFLFALAERGGRRESSQKQYRSSVLTLHGWLKSNLEMQGPPLPAEALRLYYACRRGNDKLAPSTISAINTAVKAWYREYRAVVGWAVQDPTEDSTVENFCRSLNHCFKKRIAEQVTPIRPLHLTPLFEKVNTSIQATWKALVAFVCFFFMLRASAAVRLTWGDVDIVSKREEGMVVVTVVGDKNAGLEEKQYHQSLAKPGVGDVDLIYLLRNLAAVGGGAEEDNQLLAIPPEPGGGWRYCTKQHVYSLAKELVGEELSKVGSHSFRRGGATFYVADCNVAACSVQDMGFWVTEESARKYVWSNAERKSQTLLQAKRNLGTTMNGGKGGGRS